MNACRVSSTNNLNDSVNSFCIAVGAIFWGGHTEGYIARKRNLLGTVKHKKN